MKDSLGGSGVRLHLELDPLIPPVLADRDRLKQVFINLIHNGMEALGEGGNLFVRTGPVPHAETSSDRSEDDGRGRVTVTVSDDGPGLPEEIRARLFQPFQGTKGQGHAGLGLSIVKELIDAMGGTIRYAKSDRGGASFTFSIPAHRETSPA
jgi:signal transduction histidine kinase